ncbi:L-methionine/branched-chain amino acid transporter [Archaeoglobus veneficus]|uniref:Amino acid permease-associated region n=1 Tax=Archaeoglobus veneficus (strain DSM 11195 / SNP6) TaxID=693661 RepID=F2KQI1_ARCVS|nr:L-methionine/branched-chain amino acid transporter [Archaeoglobus veneficus]AEA47714.1 amino acid permease-associated region [Archaeoglobus veneficus SNP6]
MSLRKDVTLLQAVGIFVAGILGSGILILPSIAANVAGEASLIAWLLMTVLAAPIALTFGYLASAYPSAGGIAEYSRRAFGKRRLWRLSLDAEFTTGVMFLSVIPTAIPIVLLAGASYLAMVLGLGEKGAILIALTMLLAILLMNLRGVKFTGDVQLLLSVAVIILLLSISLSALPLTSFRGYGLSREVSWNVGKAMVLIFWCYMGWEAATHLSEEFRNPRDFPLSILLSLVVIGAVYMLVSYVVVGLHAYGEGLRGLTGLLFVAERTFGGFGKILVAILGSMTCFASANVYVASSSRLLYAMSRRGYFPSLLSKLNSRRVPGYSLALASTFVALTLVLMLFYGEAIEELVLLSNTVFIILYIIGSLAGLVLLDKKLCPAIAFIVCVAILLFVGGNILYPLAIVITAVLYVTLREKKVKT